MCVFKYNSPVPDWTVGKTSFLWEKKIISPLVVREEL